MPNDSHQDSMNKRYCDNTKRMTTDEIMKEIAKRKAEGRGG